MEKLKDSGLELDKVAQDFDKLTPPESSKDIIFRFIRYDVSLPFPSTFI